MHITNWKRKLLLHKLIMRVSVLVGNHFKSNLLASRYARVRKFDKNKSDHKLNKSNEIEN